MKIILWGLFATYCVSVSWLYFSAECKPRDCYCVPPLHLPNQQNLDLGGTLNYLDGTISVTLPKTTTTLKYKGLCTEGYAPSTTTTIPTVYTLEGYKIWCQGDKCHIYDSKVPILKPNTKKIVGKVQKCKKYYDDVWCIKGRDWSKCDK